MHRDPAEALERRLGVFTEDVRHVSTMLSPRIGNQAPRYELGRSEETKGSPNDISPWPDIPVPLVLSSAPGAASPNHPARVMSNTN